MLTFRGKEWERNGNHYNLVGTKVNVIQWNTGDKANFIVEVLGKSVYEQNTFTVPGKGPQARERAILMAYEMAGKI